MRPRFVALGLVTLCCALGTALANSRVVGIPNECEMTTFRVAVTADGKGATPEKLFATSFVGDKQVARAFQMSHDGKRIAYHMFGGLALAAGNEAPKPLKGILVYKTVEWSPDSKKICYWAPDGVVIADADAQAGDKLKPESLTKGAPTNAGWTPDGSVLFLRHDLPKEKGAKATTSLMKVFASGSANELWKSDTQFFYFSLPSSRFENGSGQSTAPFSIVLGGKEALFVSSSAGSERDKLCDFKAEGLQDIVQSADSKKLLLRLSKDTVTDGGKVLKGVVLGRLDKWQKGKTLEFEDLYAKNDAHTLWCSQTGKFATWASPDVVGFRELEGKPGSEVTVSVPGGHVTGCYWDKSDARLAISAGNKLYCYDVAKKALSPVCDLGSDPRSFVADPVFRGDEVVFTQFKDTKQGK